ncbi:unnamed protein product [Boreogadus saida]
MPALRRPAVTGNHVVSAGLMCCTLKIHWGGRSFPLRVTSSSWPQLPAPLEPGWAPLPSALRHGGSTLTGCLPWAWSSAPLGPWALTVGVVLCPSGPLGPHRGRGPLPLWAPGPSPWAWSSAPLGPWALTVGVVLCPSGPLGPHRGRGPLPLWAPGPSPWAWSSAPLGPWALTVGVVLCPSGPLGPHRGDITGIKHVPYLGSNLL